MSLSVTLNVFYLLQLETLESRCEFVVQFYLDDLTLTKTKLHSYVLLTRCFVYDYICHDEGRVCVYDKQSTHKDRKHEMLQLTATSIYTTLPTVTGSTVRQLIMLECSKLKFVILVLLTH